VNGEKRYNNFVPSLSLLNSNHFADICAAMMNQSTFDGPSNIPRSLYFPQSELRFFITWDGVSINKHVSDFIMQKLQDERIKRLKTKATHGLPWRVMENLGLTWKELKRMT